MILEFFRRADSAMDQIDANVATMTAVEPVRHIDDTTARPISAMTDADRPGPAMGSNRSAAAPSDCRP